MFHTISQVHFLFCLAYHHNASWQVFHQSRYFSTPDKSAELEQYIIDNFSEEFKEVVGIDDVKEVLNIIKSAHDKARKILEENIDKLHELSEFLLEKETITGEEFMEILNGKSVDEVKEEHDAKEEAKKEAERIEVQKAQEEEKRAIEQQKRIEDEHQKNEGNILLDKTIDNEEK